MSETLIDALVKVYAAGYQCHMTEKDYDPLNDSVLEEVFLDIRQELNKVLHHNGTN